jgi:hypothetical protein
MSQVAKRGDVLEFTIAANRLAYLQDCGTYWGMGLARFLPGIYEVPLPGIELGSVVARPSLYRGACLTDYLLESGDARVVANMPIPAAEEAPPDMVTLSLGSDWRKWWVKSSDGAEMPAPDYAARHPGVDIAHLPRMADVPSVEMLKARFLDGWTPARPAPADPSKNELARNGTAGGRITRPRTLYLSFFPSRPLAGEYAVRMRHSGAAVDVADNEQDGLWKVEIVAEGYFDEELDAIARANTKDLGGTYDGDIDFST